ncbi:hypothetical protein [Hymenobacter sp. BT730]|uniref:hypothetical protein n=1 Tax=Hymenobacter sp. BT730 TaxID=3063332 RepID=UPI0026DFF267|nr:hypothetical protein [Hymenobacter sp. BT730]
MDTPSLLIQLAALGHALEHAPDPLDGSRQGPLEAARAFLFEHLAQEPQVPDRAEEVLALLAPSPYQHLGWEAQRDLLGEGLAILRQVWVASPPQLNRQARTPGAGGPRRKRIAPAVRP